MTFNFAERSFLYHDETVHTCSALNGMARSNFGFSHAYKSCLGIAISEVKEENIFGIFINFTNPCTNSLHEYRLGSGDPAVVIISSTLDCLNPMMVI